MSHAPSTSRTVVHLVFAAAALVLAACTTPGVTCTLLGWSRTGDICSVAFRCTDSIERGASCGPTECTCVHGFTPGDRFPFSGFCALSDNAQRDAVLARCMPPVRDAGAGTDSPADPPAMG